MSYRWPEGLQAAGRLALEAVGTKLTPEFEDALFDGAREKIVFGGWRAGKSRLGASEIFLDAFFNLIEGKKALYWLLGPDYGQTEQEFGYLREWFSSLDPGLIINISAPLEGPRLIELRGGIRIETKSAQYTERLGSVAPDMIICCEAGQISDETRLWVTGRSMEKRARVIYTGTLEDEAAHRQWAWYIELGAVWLHDRGREHSAYSLPSWANRTVYPGGRQDPEILHQEEMWREYTGADFAFLRRIAGEPTGTQYQVYPQLDAKELLIPMSASRFAGGAGGIDLGTEHISAIVVVTVTPGDVAWVRECQTDPYGNPSWVSRERQRLAAVYDVYEWGADPNEKFMARANQAEAVSGNAGSRESRIRLVTSRLDSGRLLFDLNGPGVPELYEEMRKVHRRKLRSGEISLDRIRDDRTAALEDAIEMIDGRRLMELQSYVARRFVPKRKTREYVRVR